MLPSTIPRPPPQHPDRFDADETGPHEIAPTERARQTGLVGREDFVVLRHGRADAVPRSAEAVTLHRAAPHRSRRDAAATDADRLASLHRLGLNLELERLIVDRHDVAGETHGDQTRTTVVLHPSIRHRGALQHTTRFGADPRPHVVHDADAGDSAARADHDAMAAVGQRRQVLDRGVRGQVDAMAEHAGDRAVAHAGRSTHAGLASDSGTLAGTTGAVRAPGEGHSRAVGIAANAEAVQVDRGPGVAGDPNRSDPGAGSVRDLEIAGQSIAATTDDHRKARGIPRAHASRERAGLVDFDHPVAAPGWARGDEREDGDDTGCCRTDPGHVGVPSGSTPCCLQTSTKAPESGQSGYDRQPGSGAR